jgi:GR25 family glycosyltransferase involved in LPS biosynthesis
LQHLSAQWPHDAGYRGLYINLDRSQSRRASVERQLAALGLADIYARLSAVDGRTLPPHKRFNPGIVGCFRSQTNALGIAAASALPIHIVEDDVVLCGFHASDNSA